MSLFNVSGSDSRKPAVAPYFFKMYVSRLSHINSQWYNSLYIIIIVVPKYIFVLPKSVADFLFLSIGHCLLSHQGICVVLEPSVPTTYVSSSGAVICTVMYPPISFISTRYFKFTAQTC
jgi:hypothetical protein